MPKKAATVPQKSVGNANNQGLKSIVDRLMDTIWSSGLTDPMECVKQITYLMFLKILDEQELSRERYAGLLGVSLENPIFDKKYENCRWHVFRQYEPKAMFENMVTKVFPFIKEELPKKKDHSALAQSMKNAIFQVHEVSTLTNMVDLIDSFDFSNMDAMGDAYEQMLDTLSSNGTAGQFRTPRQIIDMMVKLMDPNLDDIMCDPAMGTAGFVCGAARYVHDKYKSELLDATKAAHFKESMFCGYDSDPTMFNIGTMNLFLHGVEAKNIARQNSLSPDNTVRNAYSLILANPPFAGRIDKDNIAKDLSVLANTAKTELLFISLFLKSLRIGGRCASIVPDGVLFGNSSAHKAIRKELVENQRLQAVISMPSGVFLPYSGVSTAILIFTKTDKGGTDNVWFYDMKADGFSLDQKRTPCGENDIPDILARWKKLGAEKKRARNEQSFMVPKQEIVDNDYDLSINKYKEVEKVKVEFESPKVVMKRIKKLQAEINAAMDEYCEKYF